MRSSSKKRTTARERKLEEKIGELEEKLAASVSKAEYDALRSNLQLEINDLQGRLSDSVPKADLEYVKCELQRVCDLQGRMVPTEETEDLRARISELEKLLRSANTNAIGHDDRAASEMETRFEELQHALSESKKETSALREKIHQMETPSEDGADRDRYEFTDPEDSEDSETDLEESYVQSQATDV